MHFLLSVEEKLHVPRYLLHQDVSGFVNFCWRLFDDLIVTVLEPMVGMPSDSGVIIMSPWAVFFFFSLSTLIFQSTVCEVDWLIHHMQSCFGSRHCIQKESLESNKFPFLKTADVIIRIFFIYRFVQGRGKVAEKPQVFCMCKSLVYHWACPGEWISQHASQSAWAIHIYKNEECIFYIYIPHTYYMTV